jgi:hypothetical protein
LADIPAGEVVGTVLAIAISIVVAITSSRVVVKTLLAIMVVAISSFVLMSIPTMVVVVVLVLVRYELIHCLHELCLCVDQQLHIRIGVVVPSVVATGPCTSRRHLLVQQR